MPTMAGMWRRRSPSRFPAGALCFPAMKALKAHVRSGRLTLDEATTLPEGTVVDLGQVDPGDELDDGERGRLHEALRASWASAQAGRTISAEELLDRLDAEE